MRDPVGLGRMSLIGLAHIAAIAAAVLTQYGHLGQASVLIGGSC
jgi:hypothetical protein